MYNFTYFNPTRIYFGEGILKNNISKEVLQYGKNVLLVYGGSSVKKSGLLEYIKEELSKNECTIIEFGGIESNPGVLKVNKGSYICKKNLIDVIVAVGGGSVIDTAKAISASADYNGDCWDIITKKASVIKAIPIISILTITGTGSEMNSSCVITNEKLKSKRGFSNELLFPKVSFLDPTLTFSVNPFLTACGAADILSHILDTAYLLRGDKMEMLESVMESLCRTILHFAPIAVNNPSDYEARANLMWVSSWGLSGLLKNGIKQLAVCHAIEHELSARYNVVHGLGMAIVMPRYYEYVLNEWNALLFARLAWNVFNVDKDISAVDAAKAMIDKMKIFLYDDLRLTSRLSDIGVPDTDFPEISEAICWGGKLSGIELLNVKDVMKILEMCL